MDDKRLRKSEQVSTEVPCMSIAIEAVTLSMIPKEIAVLFGKDLFKTTPVYFLYQFFSLLYGL